MKMTGIDINMNGISYENGISNSVGNHQYFLVGSWPDSASYLAVKAESVNDMLTNLRKRCPSGDVIGGGEVTRDGRELTLTSSLSKENMERLAKGTLENLSDRLLTAYLRKDPTLRSLKIV